MGDSQKKRKVKDIVAAVFARSFLIFIIFLALLIFLGLFFKAKPILSVVSLPDLLFSSSWHPMKNEFGLFPFIIGTMEVTLLAMIIALPVCMLTSI